MKSYLINENFKTQFKKFVDEGIDKNIVKFYFDQFRKIKDKNANAFKQFNPHMIGFENRNFSDIDVYRTFNELEKVVDYLKG